MKNKKPYGVYDRFYESNGYGTMEVLSRDKSTMLVKFLETGTEIQANTANVLAGKVRDPSRPRSNTHDWSEWDEDFINNSGQRLKVIKKKSKQCVVQFEDTGYTRNCLYENVRNGKVRDPYAISVYGQGYQGEFKKTPFWKQAKQLWQNMMKRCYSEVDPRGYYGKAFVDSRWKCFANFLEDLPKLNNFDKWLKGQTEGSEKYNLDKDLLIKGNKYYSKEACQFITEFENKSAGGINRQAK
jgi:hypothetical protein